MVVPKGIESLVEGIGPVIVGGVSTGMGLLRVATAWASEGDKAVRVRPTQKLRRLVKSGMFNIFSPACLIADLNKPGQGLVARVPSPPVRCCRV